MEDETSIRNLILYTLNHSGFEAAGFAESESFFAALRTASPQLVLLDIMLPGDDGLSVLKKLRRHPATAQIPVMMLTAKGTEYDKVLGFELGADDYLPKPFGMMEMMARVKNLLRRTQPAAPQNEYQVGSLFVSVPRHRVTMHDVPVPLTLKEFEVLVFLLKNQGLVLSREQIMSAVWGYDFDGESRTVDVHIRTLRAKLGKEEDLITTVRGVGYQMGDNL